MIIELYTVPVSDPSGHPESPISNSNGELPDEESGLDLGDLLGSFDSREEAIAFIQEQVAERNQVIVDRQSGPFNEYSHVEWLTITLKKQDQQTASESYYLVSDEGY